MLSAREDLCMSVINHQFRLAARRPVGLPERSDWSLTEEPVRDPAEGEFLVKILYLSLDPAMRGWMNEGRSYIVPVGIGEVMRAQGVGRVIASKHRALGSATPSPDPLASRNMRFRRATASIRSIQPLRRFPFIWARSE